MKKIFLMSLFSFFLLSPINAKEKSSDPASVLALLDQARKDIQSLRFDAKLEFPKQGAVVRPGQKPKKARGSAAFFYQSPNRFNSLIKYGWERVTHTISDGNRVYTWNEKENTVISRDYEQNMDEMMKPGQSDPYVFFLAPAVSLSHWFDAKEVKILGKDHYKLTLVYRDPTEITEYDKAIMSFRLNPFALEKVTIFDHKKWVASMIWKNFILNEKIPEDEFKFSLSSKFRLVNLDKKKK